MRAYIFHLREFIYPEQSKDTELELSRFYALLHGYKIQNKKFAIDRNSEIYDIKSNEIYENDEVEIRYDLTRMEMLSGMRSTVRGYVQYSDGSFIASNEADDWLEYLGEDLLPADCRYYVKIVGNRHEKQKL